MEKNLKFRRLKRDCVKIQGEGARPCSSPLAYAYAGNESFFGCYLNQGCKFDRFLFEFKFEFEFSLFLQDRVQVRQKYQVFWVWVQADKNTKSLITQFTVHCLINKIFFSTILQSYNFFNELEQF